MMRLGYFLNLPLLQGSTFFDFYRNSRSVKSTIVHFRVRSFLTRFAVHRSKDRLRHRGCLHAFNCQHTAKPHACLCLQLRNLLWATSKHDLYFMHDHCVKHWNSLTRQTTEVSRPHCDQPSSLCLTKPCSPAHLLLESSQRQAVTLIGSSGAALYIELAATVGNTSGMLVAFQMHVLVMSMHRRLSKHNCMQQGNAHAPCSHMI